MFVIFVVFYFVVIVVVGFWVVKCVYSVKDYVVVGCSVLFFMSMVLVFVIWFGVEIVFGVLVIFLNEGLGGIVVDFFGFLFCLVIIVLFFVCVFYCLNLFIIGDFYCYCYNKLVEVVISICIMFFYLGWVVVQFMVFGLVFYMFFGGSIFFGWGIVFGIGVVLLYMFFGGMWLVVYNDVLQSVIIIVGLFYFVFLFGGVVGGFDCVVVYVVEVGKFEFWLKVEVREMFVFFVVFLIVVFGLILQQDVFQCVIVVKDVDIVVCGMLFGGLIYFCMVFVLIYFVYCALLIDLKMVELLFVGENNESQYILLNLIVSYMLFFVACMFQGFCVWCGC